MAKDENYTAPKMIDDIEASSESLAFSNGGKSINEMVHGLFDKTQYVVIRNIASVPVTWSYMPSDAEETILDNSFRINNGRKGFNEDRTRFIPGNEKYKRLDAGESGIIIGEGAYIAVENIYKLWKMEQHEKQTAERMRKTNKVDTNGAAPSFQDFIDVAKNKIVVKKVTPEMMVR